MGIIYLVTGAAGHLGSTVVNKLVKLGKQVRALVLPGDKNAGQLPAQVETTAGDVTDISSLESFFRHEEDDTLEVIHCAGIVTIATKSQPAVREVNVGGTENIVEMCRREGAEKLVYISSVHAIPEPPAGETITEIYDFNPDKVKGLYAKTKAEATSIVMQSAARGLNASVIHPSGISGPGDHGRGHLTQLVIDYYNGSLTAGINGGYDFVDVRDVADGIISCCEKGRPGEGYILSNRFIKISELFGMLHKITGHREIKTFLPMWFAKATAPLAELYYKILRQPPLFTSYSLYTLSSNAEFSHAKAAAELGYVPRGFEETLRDTVEWLKEQKRI